MLDQLFARASLILMTGIASCDAVYGVHVRAALDQPADTACLRNALTRLTGQGIAGPRRGGPDGEQLSSVSYGTPSWRSDLTQVVGRDSSVYLEARYERVNQELVAGQGDSAIAALSELVIQVRESCGGRPAAGVRDLVELSTSPPYEAWIAPGTKARVSVRWATDEYRLQVDTLPEHFAAPRGERVWVRADRVRVPRLPKGSTLATACRRGDALPEGRIVALVRKGKRGAYTDVVEAWQLDAGTLRFAAAATEGIECRKTGWSPVTGAN